MPNEFVIRNQVGDADIATVHRYLAEDSYWAKGIPYDVVHRSMANSLSFVAGVPGTDALAGYARIVTDRATFAYLCDVFVLPEYRGQGVSKQLMEAVLAHPDLQGLRRMLLFTRDAHTLYEQFGFTAVPHPEAILHRHDPQVYSGGA